MDINRSLCLSLSPSMSLFIPILSSLPIYLFHPPPSALSLPLCVLPLIPRPPICLPSCLSIIQCSVPPLMFYHSILLLFLPASILLFISPSFFHSVSLHLSISIYLSPCLSRSFFFPPSCFPSIPLFFLSLSSSLTSPFPSIPLHASFYLSLALY